MTDSLLYLENQSIFTETETKSTENNSFILNGYQEYYNYLSNNINYEDNFKVNEIATTVDEISMSEKKSLVFYDESCSMNYNSIKSPTTDNNSNDKSFNNIIIFPNLDQTVVSNEINKLNLNILNEKISNLEEYVDELTNKLVYYKIKEDYTSILERELEVMNKKLNYAIPIHAIIYMCVNMFILGISSMLLYLRFVSKIYTIDPHYLIGATIISLGLFLTALVSLKDWKEFLKDNEFEQ